MENQVLLICCSTNCNGQTNSQLTPRGYDVWLANSRGTIYSRGHTNLTTNDTKYWDFGWDEVGLYVNPAFITYIHNKTNQTMFYIGHSLGATTFGVTCVERPDIAQYLRAMFALAPATYAARGTQATFRLGALTFREPLSHLSVYDPFGRNLFFNTISDVICPVLPAICDQLIFFLGGYDIPELPKNVSGMALGLVPAGTSIKLAVQCFQQVELPIFRRFNYGTPAGNLKVYNSPEPPVYNLTKVQVPVAVFYSHADLLVGAADAEMFYNEVPKKLGLFAIEPYSHFDYLIGINAPTRVYSTIFRLMSQS